LTEYYDSIMANKSIATNSLHRIAWEAFALKIENDCLFTYGLLFTTQKSKCNWASDTFATLNYWGKIPLFYNSLDNRIHATNTEPNNYDPYKHRNYTFRKVTEGRLLEALQRKTVFEISNGIVQIFIDSLLAAEYHGLDNKSGSMRIRPDGGTDGFKNYRSYVIANFFGTRHPTGDYDAIFFEDTTVAWSGKHSPPLNRIVAFNWKFGGDTLTLTEMVSNDDGTRYVLGEQRYRFLKAEPSKP